MNLWTIENELMCDGWRVICGVDEAGRGPLAGPVYAAAVILPRGLAIEGLNDSKKLSAKMREKLYVIIKEKAVSWSVASASVCEIDELNILNATFLAMNRAISALDVDPEIALIDGNQTKGITFPCKWIIGGDGKSASIAAASILAKVSRDRYMAALGEKYPEYLFEKNKGYGTPEHYACLRKFGPSIEHRKVFLRKMH